MTLRARPSIIYPLRAEMACSASFSFAISTKANPRDRPVSRSVIMRALLTEPYRSKRLRTDSSVASNFRLPTKIFFTHCLQDDLKAGASGRTLAGRRTSLGHSAGLAEAIKCALNITRTMAVGKQAVPASVVE